MFNKWVSEFPSNIEMWIAHYPGRGARHNEPPINSLTVLVEKLSQAIQPFLDNPFAFFGHSLGALVAFELTRHLRKHHLPQPNILFISACGAPHLHDPYPPIHALPDTKFLEALQKLNGIPAELLHQPDVIQLLLRTLRADFEVIENYHYTSDVLLNCPIIAFGGIDDPRVSRERLGGWASHTNSRFQSQYFSGDHFFINKARESIMTTIANEIISSHAKS